MINKEQVSTLCEETLANSDRFLVEVKTKETGKMQGKLVSFDAEKVEFAPAPKKSSKKKPAEEPVNLFFERNKVEVKPAIIF